MKSIYNFFIAIPILVTLAISLIFSGLGVYETLQGMSGIFRGLLHTNEFIGLKFVDALDMFLISLLFLIFSLGFSQLFLLPSAFTNALSKLTPAWLHVKNFTELKLILWETILTTMIIMFVSELIKSNGNYKYEFAIYPIGIILIALSGFFIRSGEKMHQKKENGE